MVEKIFKRGTEKVDDEDVVQTLLTKVINIRDTGCDSVSCWRESDVVARGYLYSR